MLTGTWEDLINPAGHNDVLAEHARAMAEQRAAMEAIRGTIVEPPPLIRPHRAQPVDLNAVLTADRIKAIRASLGLSQDRMARELGVQQKTYADWELGVSTPRRVHCRVDLLALERLAQEREAGR